MNEGKVSSCIGLIKGLTNCDPNVRALNIRRLLLADSSLLEDILRDTWTTISSWLTQSLGGLTENEVLRITTLEKKARKEGNWFDNNSEGSGIGQSPQIKTMAAKDKLRVSIHNGCLHAVKNLIAQHPDLLR